MDRTMISDWVVWLVPVIASWILSQWQRLGTWLKPKANWIKILAYFVLVAAGMILLVVVRWAVTPLPADWQSVFWNTFVGGLAGTFIYKIGHHDAEP